MDLLSEPEVVESEVDDWGDFSGFISGLEAEEKAESEPEQTEEQEEGISPEAFEGILGVMFTVVEQATSLIAGVDFAFDCKGKAEVTRAAVPVLSKHGGQFLGWFGDYIEEATLLIAVLCLVHGARSQLKELKQQKIEREKDEKQVPVAQAA